MGSTTSNKDVPHLINQLKALKAADFEDDSVRKNLLAAVQKAALNLEGPGESINRIAYSGLQNIVARLASDLKLFETLANNGDKPLSTQELSEGSKADPVLLARILHYLNSVGMIDEVGEELWKANHITKTLSVPGLKAGIYHNHDYVSPCWHAVPDFLAETNYQNPTDFLHSPFQKGHNTTKSAYEWAMDEPARFNNFIQWMMAHRAGQPIFLDVYPFEQEHGHNLKPEDPLFVDVGGGVGHQCLALKQKLPHLKGRVVLQDLPPVIAQAIPCEGVEHTVHDFTAEQPVKGARVYYLRNIIHDFPDQKSIQILQKIIEAMTPDSFILIDEMVIPNQGADWRQTQLDFTMMAGLAAMERTEKQWYKLLDEAGLHIKKILTYTPDLKDSVIVAVPKKT